MGYLMAERLTKCCWCCWPDRCHKYLAVLLDHMLFLINHRSFSLFQSSSYHSLFSHLFDRRTRWCSRMTSCCSWSAGWGRTSGRSPTNGRSRWDAASWPPRDWPRKVSLLMPVETWLGLWCQVGDCDMPIITISQHSDSSAFANK